MTKRRRLTTTLSRAFSCAATFALLASGADAQGVVDPIVPINTVRIMDSMGKLVGYPVEMSTTRFVIAMKPATALGDDDPIMLVYQMSKRTRDGLPIGKWSVDGQKTLHFSGPNCTGQAYTLNRDDRVVRRIAAVTRDNRLFVSSDAPIVSTYPVLSAEGDQYDGEFLCTNYGAQASAAVRDAVTVDLVGDLDQMFIPPFNTASTGARFRAAPH